jgi:lipopolysaccharide transport system permease protein
VSQLEPRALGVMAPPAGPVHWSSAAASATRNLFLYRALVRNLVAKDLKVKYRQSFLGFLWSLLHPAFMLIVYTFAFKVVLKVQRENYVYFLVAGLLPWTFFSGALIASTQAITGNAALIRRIYFPRELLPIASVLFNFTQLLLALVVFIPAILFGSGLRPSWAMALTVPLLLLHLIFTVGLAFALSSVTVHFRDVSHLIEVFLPLLFWLTPILYPIEMVPDVLRGWMTVSPLALFAISYQDVLVKGILPSPTVFASLVGWTFATLYVGYLIFYRLSPRMAEEV